MGGPVSLDLRCHLEVIHVPAVVMIDQGTDGEERDQMALTTAEFAPLVPDMALAYHYAALLENTLPMQLHDWHHPWGAGFEKRYLWCCFRVSGIIAVYVQVVNS